MIDPAIRAGDTLFSIDSEPVTGRRFETIMQMLQEAVQKAKGHERAPKLCLTFAHLAPDQTVGARSVAPNQGPPSPPHTPPVLPDSHQSQDTYGILAELAFDHLHPAGEGDKKTKKPKKAKKAKKEKKKLTLQSAADELGNAVGAAADELGNAVGTAADELGNAVGTAADHVGDSIARIRSAAALPQQEPEYAYDRPHVDGEKKAKKKKKKKKKKKRTAE